MVTPRWNCNNELHRQIIVSFSSFDEYNVFWIVRKILQENLGHEQVAFFDTKIDIKTEWWLLYEIVSLNSIENKLSHFD